jgi:hypothetical protein
VLGRGGRGGSGRGLGRVDVIDDYRRSNQYAPLSLRREEEETHTMAKTTAKGPAGSVLNLPLVNLHPARRIAVEIVVARAATTTRKLCLRRGISIAPLEGERKGRKATHSELLRSPYPLDTRTRVPEYQNRKKDFAGVGEGEMRGEEAKELLVAS